MKPKHCRECHRPMEYCLHEWRCTHGDCERALEPVRDRMRSRRASLIERAGLRRARMLAIRQANRCGIKCPRVTMPGQRGPCDISIAGPDLAFIYIDSWSITHRIGGHYRGSEGADCLHCEPGIACRLHEVPF